MRRAGKITAAARALAREMVKPGVTTQQIDKAVFHFIREQGAVPSFLHYNGYPASVCISVNDEIIHGIPGKRVLQRGRHRQRGRGGVHRRIPWRLRRHLSPAGRCPTEAQRLIRCDPAELLRGHQVRPRGLSPAGYLRTRFRPMWRANGFSVVREYVGHGVGRQDARGAGGAQLRQSRPGPPASAGHDHRSGTHGQRGRRRHQADAATAGR